MSDNAKPANSYDRASMVPDAVDSSQSTYRSHLHDADPSRIQGWGADLDPANRPAVPMERIPPRLNVPWTKPGQQPVDREVLISVEYPEMRPIFGDGPVPSGLSGIFRRLAFRRSENDSRHWLMLMAADRINEIEGIIEDVTRGHVPNVFAEMGWKAKFKHDTAKAIFQSALIAGTVGYLGYLAFGRRDEDADED